MKRRGRNRRRLGWLGLDKFGFFLEHPLHLLRTGRVVGFGGAVWIEGKQDGASFTTEPGWLGPLAPWKARRYARRNGITLERSR